jgi:hypothetical protein
MLSLPGLRVFASARFRLAVAGLLLALGIVAVGAYLVSRAGQPLDVGQFGIDFADYRAAAERLADSGSPYAPDMLAGPVDAQGLDRYRYPPPFAQLLVPLRGISLGAATWLWLLLQAACLLAAAWLAGEVGGLPRSLERALWTGAATAWFLPVLDTLWKGNVSGLQALLVALLFAGPAASGGALAANGLLKLTPVVLVPLAPLRGRLAATALLATTAAIVVPSLALAPQAWRDYAVVLGNLLGGSADYPSNLAPDALLRHAFGLSAPWDAMARVGALGLGLGLLVLGWRWARRPDGWAAAVTAGVAATLLIPAALWYHYLAVLLPVAVVAWERATGRERAGIFAGAALVSIGIAWLPLALAGGVVIVGCALAALRPGVDRP